MSSGRAVACLVAAALFLRLFSLYWLASPTPALDADALWYHLSAVGLAEGRGYVHHFTGQPTAAWPPGYPAILAVVYRLFGADPWRAFVLNAFAGTLTCWLAGRLARQLVSENAGVVATALMAFAPSQILLASLVLTETIFTTIMTALVVAAAWLLHPSRRFSAAAWLLWGAGVGLAGLIRAEAVLLVAAPAAVVLMRHRKWTTALAIAVCVTTGSLAAQLPWLVRNAHVFGRIVPASTSFGRTLLIGHNPVADGGMNLYSPDPAADQRELYVGGPQAELRVDNRLRDAAVRYAFEHPARELHLVLLRLYHLYRGDRVWSVWYAGDSPSPVPARTIESLSRASNGFYWLLLAASLPSFAWFLVAGDPRRRLVPVLILLWSVFYGVVLYGSERFHVPLMPLLCVLAAATLCEIPRTMKLAKLAKPAHSTRSD